MERVFCGNTLPKYANTASDEQHDILYYILLFITKKSI